MLGTFWPSAIVWTMIPLLTLSPPAPTPAKVRSGPCHRSGSAPAAAAAGLAQINALGNLSGFFFNYMIGWIKDETGSFPLALMPIAAVATLGVICLLTIGARQPRTEPIRA